MLAFILAYTTTGHPAGKLFEPLIQPAGDFSGSAGQIIDVGGRVIAGIFILIGNLVLLTVVTISIVRKLDMELPGVTYTQAPDVSK